MLITTGYNFEGYNIVSYMDVITSTVVLGTGMFSSFGASVSDFTGSRSGSYERKLESAKNQALGELKSRASSMGGSGIIGIDIDYTTFSADVIAVIASGTVVKVQKNIMQDTEIDNDSSLVRVPVCSYNVNLPFNIFSLNIQNNSLNEDIVCNMRLKNYSPDKKIEAIIADIELESLFKEKSVCKNVILTLFPLNDGVGDTEFVKITLDKYIRPSLIKKAYVTVKKIMFEDEEILDIDLSQYVKDTQISASKLEQYRKVYGYDAMLPPESMEKRWICSCGATNDQNTDVCYRCKRKKEVGLYQGDSISFSELLLVLSEKENAKEIFEYVKKLNMPELNKLEEELKDLMYSERFFGNMKDSAIMKAKKFLT